MLYICGMSRNRKLQFFSLAGKKEAQALHSIQANEFSQVNIKDDYHLAAHLKNAIWMALNQGKKLAICLTPYRHQGVMSLLENEGLGTCLFSFSQRRDRAKLSSFLDENPVHDESNWVGLWNQLYHQGELSAYRNQALQKNALGEKNIRHIISQYIGSVHLNTSSLDQTVDLDQYDFISEEYWFLRGRIHAGAQIWDDSLTQSKHLSLLHPVFFDMYKAEEAYIVIYEMTRKYKSINEELISKLLHWKQEYRTWMTEHHANLTAQIRSEILRIRQNALEEIRREPVSVKNWMPFQKGKETDSTQDVVDAFHSVRQQLIDLDIHDDAGLPDTQDIKLAIESMERLLGKFGVIKKALKKKGDIHLQRLNKHTILDATFKRKYERIWSPIQEMLEEINGFQLFKDHIHHHALELNLLENNLMDLASKWEGIESELTSLIPYIKWNQFKHNLELKSQNLLEALTMQESSSWIEVFEAWYIRHYLECQDLGFMGTQPLEQEWKPLWVNLKEKLKSDLHRIALVDIQSGISSFMQSSKHFANWIKNGREYSHLPQDQDLLSDRMTITFFDESDKEQIVMWRPDWVLTDLEISPNAWKVAESVPHIQQVTQQQGIPVRYTPQVHSNILLSEHHLRMNQVKEVACFLENTLDGFQVWQNNKTVVISALDKEANKLIRDGLEKHLTFSGDQTSMTHEEWMETLLNNHDREFIFLYPTVLQSELDRLSPIGSAELVQFLQHIGVQTFEVSWELLMANAKIVRHLSHDAAIATIHSGKNPMAT